MAILVRKPSILPAVMKRNCLILLFFLLFASGISAQQTASDFITEDIEHFWRAYDKITATTDSAEQYAYLKSLFLDKGTPGLKAIMQARNYTAKSYIDAINKYPKFWNSVRNNTLRSAEFADSIAQAVKKLKVLYPDLKPAKIYFTIGALRTGGTTLKDMVLIGSEIALGDHSTITTELPAQFSGLKAYFKANPIGIIVFTNVHEYVHTQQKTTIGKNLLAQCVLEGVAEFMAEKAMGNPSTLPAISFGRLNAKAIKRRFKEQMFDSSTGFWLYSNQENEFKIRDLGYYVGYAICESYYRQSVNKNRAIKEMIELDYNNDTAMEKFINKSGYFN